MSDKSHFFAHLARLKLINRWPLMHNVRTENVQEHSLQVAMVAHALALIKNKFFGGTLNPDRIATMAIFHDVSEVLTHRGSTAAWHSSRAQSVRISQARPGNK